MDATGFSLVDITSQQKWIHGNPFVTQQIGLFNSNEAHVALVNQVRLSAA